MPRVITVGYDNEKRKFYAVLRLKDGAEFARCEADKPEEAMTMIADALGEFAMQVFSITRKQEPQNAQ